MKNPKEKGNRYEREIARKLSLWISEGEDSTLLWRSDSSGGRATQHGNLATQAGDIAADSRVGYDFIDLFHVECKHYKNIFLDQLVWRTNKGDNCYGWWLKYTKEALKYGKNLFLCCKQNNKFELLLIPDKVIKIFELENFAIEI